MTFNQYLNNGHARKALKEDALLLRLFLNYNFPQPKNSNHLRSLLWSKNFYPENVVFIVHWFKRYKEYLRIRGRKK